MPASKGGNDCKTDCEEDLTNHLRIVGTVNPQFPEYNLFSGAGSINRRFIMAHRTIWNFQIVAGCESDSLLIQRPRFLYDILS